ncbi:MAG: PLP-dependent aminotransferase family protein [Eubacteriales bacterium]
MHIDLNRKSKEPITKQLYNEIKLRILSGILHADEKIVSSRKLSAQLKISRNVALDAYNQLIAEGYLYTKDRSGVFVSGGVQHDLPQIKMPDAKDKIIGLQHEPQKNQIDFRTGIPNFSIFPKEKWGKLYRQICMDLPINQLDYYEPRGCYELRLQLTKYLYRVRGVKTSPENILITSGAAQGFNLLVKHFSKINKSILTEDPISYGITQILDYYGMDINTIAVDESGMQTEKLTQEKYAKINPSLIFTTPSHQFPTGAILPINRRIQLVNYAKGHGSYIVEDDYDSEFRYAGYPIASMHSLAPQSIIYLGTFTKMLFPALRLGYIILPDKLIDDIMRAKYIGDLHSPILEQITLAKFIETGLLDRHVEISRKYYNKKCEFLINQLESRFGSTINIYGHSGGIHLMVKFNNIYITDEILNDIEKAGILIKPAKDHYINNTEYNNCLLFGFGNASDENIEQGLSKIQSILKC